MSDLIVSAAFGSLIGLFLVDHPASATPQAVALEPTVELATTEQAPASTSDAAASGRAMLTPLPEPESQPRRPVETAPAATVFDPVPAPTVDTRPRPEDFNIPQANARCIALMEGFPNDSLASRYQFYRLVQDMSRGMTADVRAAVDAYGEGTVPANAPVMDTIEQITNPVLRQAAPATTVAQLSHLIGFGTECADFIDGQVTGLAAADPSLNEPEFNLAIGQDALFLRQILLDSLYRLGADADPQHGTVIASYQRGLVSLRNDMEFAAFDAELAELEALAMGDLGDRLDVANASVNDGMYDDSTTSAVRLAKDMSDAARRDSQQRMAQILVDILGRY